MWDGAVGDRYLSDTLLGCFSTFADRFGYFSCLTGANADVPVAIADDDEGLRQVLAEFLAHQGFDVLLAVDGRHAFELVGRESPRFSILDFHMPGLSGLEVLRLLAKGSPRRERKLPCILMSAEASPEERREARRFGAFRFLEKPLHPEDLLRSIGDILEAFPTEGAPARRPFHPLALYTGSGLPVPLDLLESLKRLLEGMDRRPPGPRRT